MKFPALPEYNKLIYAADCGVDLDADTDDGADSVLVSGAEGMPRSRMQERWRGMSETGRYLVLVLVVVAVVSYLLRALPFVLFGSGRRPPAVAARRRPCRSTSIAVTAPCVLPGSEP